MKPGIKQSQDADAHPRSTHIKLQMEEMLWKKELITQKSCWNSW